MATETHVFFHGRPPSKAALSRAMRELGFPITIPEAKGSLAQQSGFLPMRLRRDETGVEFDLFDRTAIAEFADCGVDPRCDRMASFRWSGDLSEAAAGICGAAALAKITGGAVFDEAEGKLLSVPEAVAAARQVLESLPKEDPRLPGTRPPDIKRYLAPLFKQRSDLVLIGRMLFIRPVRHILRGVFLDRTSDKYTFNIRRYIRTLYGGAGLGDDFLSLRYEVWQPHFQELLLDTLAEDVFDQVGRIRSLSDLGREVENTTWFTNAHIGAINARLRALVLSGERERADEYVTGFEQQSGPPARWSDLRTVLEADVASLCADCHAREAATAKALKIEKFWEPAPFPVEVPARARAARCDEPRFDPKPWPERPPWLVADAPEQPGEVRFARVAHWRKGGIALLLPLSRGQAEALHDNREEYALATRLPAGQLLVLKHWTHWSPHDPEQPKNPDYVPWRNYHLWIYGSTACLLADFDEDFDKLDLLRMSSVSVRKPNHGEEFWYGFNNFREGELSIYDRRFEASGRERQHLTPAELRLCEFKAPPLGGFDEFLSRTVAYLETKGFGPLPE